MRFCQINKKEKYAQMMPVTYLIFITEMRLTLLVWFSKINELVDARDLNMGAWFEAQIVNVTKTVKTPIEEGAKAEEQEEILYHVKYEE